MKRKALSLLICCCIILSALPALAEMSISIGMRSDMFSNDRLPEDVGYEITAPLGFAWRGDQFQCLLESAYSSANIHAEEESVRFSSLTDTRVSGSYAWLNMPVGLIVGLDMNLPTGTATLDASERKVEIGENGDLFEVDDFGEGFNIAPSVGLVKEFGKLSFGGNVAYLYRGEYDPTTEIDDDTLAPGDQALLLTFLKWRASKRFMLDGLLSYSYFAEDTLDGESYFQEGQTFVAGANASFYSGRWSVDLSLQQLWQGKNKELDENDELQTETKNSNATEFFGLLDLNYRYTPVFSFRFFGDLRYYGESDRREEQSGLLYDGGRRRYALGLGFLYLVDEHFSVNALAKLFTLEKHKDLYTDEDIRFQGGNLALGVAYNF